MCQRPNDWAFAACDYRWRQRFAATRFVAPPYAASNCRLRTQLRDFRARHATCISSRMNATMQFVKCRLITLTALSMSCAPTSLAADSAPGSQDSAQWQSQDSIRMAAQNYVEANIGGGSGNARTQVAELDPRLKLPVCTAPLHAELPYGRGRSTRVTVRVSCSGQQGWRIHVPVNIVTIGRVVSSTRALARGTILTADHLSLTQTQLGQLGHGYFSRPQDVIGQRVKRPIAAGAILTPAQLETPPAIRRGQTVTVVANAQGIGVKMSGVALSNGAIGQIINVENASSGKRIQGIVRSSRSVEILLR
jgi:flagella basal body P-ring formation protein FlgA